MSDDRYYHPHPYFVNDRGRFVFDIDLELDYEEEILQTEVRQGPELRRDNSKEHEEYYEKKE